MLAELIALFLWAITFPALKHHAGFGTIAMPGITILLFLIGVAHDVVRGPR